MIEIIRPDGTVAQRSANLRGILNHACRTWIAEAVASSTQAGSGILRVTFGDGCTCHTEFASYVVLCAWLRRKWSWAGVRRIGQDLF